MNLGESSVDGVAKDIAKALKVKCTAARGNGGLNFWHRKGQKLEQNSTKTKPTQPFWLWNVGLSRWVTYDAKGNELEMPVLFGKPRTKDELPTGGKAPPQWLVNLYDAKVD